MTVQELPDDESTDTLTAQAREAISAIADPGTDAGSGDARGDGWFAKLADRKRQQQRNSKREVHHDPMV